jgi:hypothetical protein
MPKSRRRQQQLAQDAARVSASLAALQKLYDDQSRNFHAERLQTQAKASSMLKEHAETLAKVLSLLALLVQTYKY